MIWLVLGFSIFSWFTPVLSVSPAAFVYATEGTKISGLRWFVLASCYIIWVFLSISWCGFLSSLFINLVCLLSYIVPMKLFAKLKSEWKLLNTEIVFFLVTNFVCWLTMHDTYTRDLNGLILCYVMAIPFFIRSLVSCFAYYIVFRSLLTVRINNYGMSVSC